ncbi:MAG: nitrite reductase/ring-hydroxylating ferredoxin subunit [Zhongshania sp.]|jgi:nitrite reductase/ring-hydroxylating ferredoxin subunit
MEHATQVEILKSLIHKIDSKTTADADHIMAIDASSYADESVAAREWEILFQEHPQILGMSGDLPESGSYFTSDELGMPIICTRDSAGKFHAFINSCRHRGAQLTDECRGTKARLVCPFHAWTYTLDGRLTGVRHNEQFGNINKDELNLIELPAQEKYGFLAVHPKVNGAIDLDDLLGAELAKEVDGWGFDKCVFEADSSIDMPLNWKLANDTFGEVYHFSVLHKNTLAKILQGDFAVARSYGSNHLLCVATKYLDTMKNLPDEKWSLPFGAFMSYFLFPNIQVVFVSGMVTLVRIYPDPKNVGRSISRISHYSIPQITAQLSKDEVASTITDKNVYEADVTTRLELNVTASLELFNKAVEHEDYLMGAQAQISASSGKVNKFLFGRNEPTLQHFHQEYRRALGMTPLERYQKA